MTGWNCPTCGASFAPTVDECRYCNHGVQRTQSGSSFVLQPSVSILPYRCGACGMCFDSFPHYCTGISRTDTGLDLSTAGGSTDA